MRQLKLLPPMPRFCNTLTTCFPMCYASGGIVATKKKKTQLKFWETSHFPRCLVPRPFRNGRGSEPKTIHNLQQQDSQNFLDKIKGVSQDLYPKFLWSDEYGFQLFLYLCSREQRLGKHEEPKTKHAMDACQHHPNPHRLWAAGAI